MKLIFNPLTGNFDFIGSLTGWAGEVNYYADLPDNSGGIYNGQVWHVLNSSGFWPIKKASGFYLGQSNSWSYRGVMTLGAAGDYDPTGIADKQAIAWDAVNSGYKPRTFASIWDELTGTATKVPFDTTPASIPSTDGTLYHDPVTDTLTYYNKGKRLNIGQEQRDPVFNNSGATILNGKAVYIDGTGSDGVGGPVVSAIFLAKADQPTTANFHGVTTEDIPNNSYGEICVRGDVNDINTIGMGVVNDKLYVSPTIAGGFTTTKPNAPNIPIEVGTLQTVSATVGKIHVYLFDALSIYNQFEEKALQDVGISAATPITASDISINTTTRVLTVTPPLGFFVFYIDGAGLITKYIKTGNVDFPAFTDTSGTWFFYFNSSGVAVTTQTPWTTLDYPNIAGIYRIVWNATLTGANKLVDQYIEYHLNDLSYEAHQWFHLQGSQWINGFTMANNALISGAPNADGRNTVIAVTTGTNVDDNLEYTVTNSTGGAIWQQDLGNTTPASLKATNSALFKIFTQDAGGLISFLPATRFPFPWDAGTNQPQFIAATGTRTAITNGNFMVAFIYATQNPVSGDALKVVTPPAQYTTLTNARAVTWVDIQNTYSIFADDHEIRPLYRLIFEVHTGSPSVYDVGAKYSVLRETQDLRKGQVTSLTTLTGSIPASSVTYIPTAPESSTNDQTALDNRPNYAVLGALSTGLLKVTTGTGALSTAVAGTDYILYARELLSAARTYYVRTDGNDTNSGLINTAGGAFLTINKAINVINATLDTGGYDVTIQVADGTYTTPIVAKDIIGGGAVIIQGNTGNISAVVISTTSANAFSHSAFGLYKIQYLKTTTITSGACLYAGTPNSILYFQQIDFGTSAQHHITSYSGAYVAAIGAYSITGNCANNHVFTGYGGTCIIAGITVTLTGTLSCAVYASATASGIIRYSGVTFAGSYTMTGSRYTVDLNSVINTLGGGASYLPGNSAGTTATGGQYA
jgi:hypothetical protein